MSRKSKLKLLGRIREARLRMRDHAAGAFAVAEAEQVAADERRDEAVAEIDVVKDSAMAQLSASRSVRVLWTLEHQRDLAAAQLADAEKALVVARDETDRQRVVLARRARDLKTAEKVIDQTRTGLRRDENRAEQRSNDDLASRTRRDD